MLQNSEEDSLSNSANVPRSDVLDDRLARSENARGLYVRFMLPMHHMLRNRFAEQLSDFFKEWANVT